MIRRITLLFCLFTCLYSYGENTAILSGSIYNTPSRVITVEVMVDFPRGLVTSKDILLDRKQSFKTVIPLNQGTNVNIKIGSTLSIPLFLQPGDSLGVKGAIRNNKVQAQFFGESSFSNAFFSSFMNYAKGIADKQKEEKLIEKMQITDYWAYVKQNTYAKKTFFRKYSTQGKDTISTALRDWMDIYFNYSEVNRLLRIPIEHKNVSNINKTLPDYYRDVLKSVPINNENALNHVSYWEYMITFIDYHVLKDRELSGLDLLVRRYQFAGQALKGKPKHFMQYFLLNQMIFSDPRYAKPEYLAYVKSNAPKHLKEAIKGRYESMVYPFEGSKMPDFSLKDKDGNKLRFSDLKGKTLYVTFWHNNSWRNHQELYYSNSLRRKFKDETNILFVYISMDRTESNWKKHRLYKTKHSPEIKNYIFDFSESQSFDYFLRLWRDSPHFMIVDTRGVVVNENAKPPSTINAAIDIRRALKY